VAAVRLAVALYSPVHSNEVHGPDAYEAVKDLRNIAHAHAHAHTHMYKYIYIEQVRTLAETKIGSLVYSNSPLGSTVVIGILRFFVTLYLLFMPSHRYRTRQNRSCQLLLNVRMQYGCFTQCQKRIKSLISFKASVLFGRVIREIQINFRCSEIAHWYNT
jgi:hypothetical protein